METDKPECLECKKPMPWVSQKTFEENEIFCSLDCNQQYLGEHEANAENK